MKNILKLTKPMMHGSAVKRLQEQLEILKINVNIDGIYGPSTEKAVKLLQWQAGIREDGIVGANTRKVISDLIGVKHHTLIFAGSSDLVDISDRHKPPKLSALRKLNPTGVTWHQTGCKMPKDPMGWSRVNAHYGLTQEGLPILINKPDMFIWHAQGLSRFTIGIEVEGNYPGLTNNPNTLWRGGGGPHSVNDKMIAGAMSIVKDIEQRLSDRAEAIVYYAHRQSSPNRRACPGQEIWEKIVVPCMTLIGAVAHPQRTIGKGRTLPTGWGYRDKY